MLPAEGQYHYPGCGCDAGPLALPCTIDAAVWRRVRVSPRGMRELDAWRAITPRLRVLYLLPHHNLTGGMKMLVGQLSALRAGGHAVIAAYRAPAGSPVLPPWAAEVEVDATVLVPPRETWAQVVFPFPTVLSAPCMYRRLLSRAQRCHTSS